MAPARSYSDLCLEISRRYSDGSSPPMSDACSETLATGADASFAFGMVSAGEVIRRLEEELEAARGQLKERDEKVSRLSLMQTTVDSEVQELTEKLFTEAYKMVNVAEERRERAERLQRESKLKVDVLQAEVDALKLIVSTSGAGFNHHHHSSSSSHSSPLHQMKREASHSPFGRLFNSSKPKPSPSSSSSSSAIPHSTSFPVKSKSASLPSTSGEKERTVSEEQRRADQIEEIDPVYYREFSAWREAGHPMSPSVPSNNFIARIEAEDVRPCMLFDNETLSDAILAAIRENSLEIEPLNEDKPVVQTCVLSNVPRFCPYRVRTTADADWINISLLARNRIAAVCDFYTYLRYLSLGLVRTGLRDAYFDVIALRKNMALARLGLGFVPKTTLARPGSGFH